MLSFVEGQGFVSTSWDEVMTKTVSEIQRIQEKYGNYAFSMLSGVSLTNEKSYLVGKFARVALKKKKSRKQPNCKESKYKFLASCPRNRTSFKRSR